MFLSKLFVSWKKNPFRINYIAKLQCSTTRKTYQPSKTPTVAILDVLSTPLGKNVALLLKQSPHIGELRLYDKDHAVCELAEDLSHIDTRTKVKSFGGISTLRQAVEGARVVLSVGGCKTDPGEPPNSMFERNINDVRNAAMHLAEFNSKAVFCIAKPPLEALVPMASEEYKKSGVYDNRKIIGITSAASMRANYFIGKATGKDPTLILCPIVGGFSEKTTVAVISQTRPRVQIDPQNFAILQDCISYGEDDVLNLYEGCHTVCLAPALAISRFINNLLKALMGYSNCVECAFVSQTGQIAQFLTYMTSIVRLGEHGIQSCHMPKINKFEAGRLKAAAVFIRQNIRMGENYGLEVAEDKGVCLDDTNTCNLIDAKKESTNEEMSQMMSIPKQKITTEHELKKEKP